MSSKVKWGGIAGLVAAALWIISAILNQVSPGAAGSNLYLDVVVLAAYIAVIVAVLGIHALHSGTSRYGRLGTTGAVLTIAGYAIIGVVVVISMVQGQRSLLPVRLTGAGLVLVGSALAWCDHYLRQIAALVVRRIAHRGLSDRPFRERALQFC
jgi:prepilin signal peptidase PulO-like enzyme (type II secretory pathway)